MRFLKQVDLEKIYFKGILPSVLYCITIWGNCSNSLMQEVNNIHIKAARFIFRIKKTVSDQEILDKYQRYSISWYYKRRVACITYNLYSDAQCISPIANLIYEFAYLRIFLIYMSIELIIYHHFYLFLQITITLSY